MWNGSISWNAASEDPLSSQSPALNFTVIARWNKVKKKKKNFENISFLK